jgi:hypothetical protein
MLSAEDRDPSAAREGVGRVAVAGTEQIFSLPWNPVIELSRRGRDLQKRLRRGAALGKFNSARGSPVSGARGSGTVKTGSLLVILEGDLPWRRDLPGTGI